MINTEVEWSGLGHMHVYEDITLLCENINNLKNNAEVFLQTTIEINIGVNIYEIKNVSMSQT
jgi:hypothetical protein